MFYSLFLLTISSVLSQKTVPSLDLNKYQGRWYQVYGNKYDQLFEKYSSCITADYGLVPYGNVTVLNAQLDKSREIQKIEGYAYYSSYPVEYPGRLTVHLDGVPEDAPYWIYNLGPVVNGLYDWAIVSDQFRVSLFVLTRNVESFYKNYNDEVLTVLETDGFNVDTLIKVSHNDCIYIQ